MHNPDYPVNEGQSAQNAESADAPENNDAASPAHDDAAPASAGGTADDADNEGAAENEIAQLKDQVMRLAAELENTRRRGEREKREAGQYAIANFARDLIGVADNFERALNAAGVSDDQIPEGRSDAFHGLVAGIQMTEKELLKTLERHGVIKLEPAGEKFDPNLHQAVANVPSAEVGKGNVVDVAQPGFTIGDRVLRAAMVTVSSGAPAGGAAPAAGSDGDNDA